MNKKPVFHGLEELTQECDGFYDGDRLRMMNCSHLKKNKESKKDNE